MNTEWAWYAVILVLNTLACLSVAFLLSRQQQIAPGQAPMILLFLALSFWSFGYAMLLVSPTLEMKIFWLRVENLGIIPQSAFWFFFALQFSTQNRKTPLWLTLLIGFLPAVCLTVILGGGWIYNYYPSIELLHPEGGGPLKLQRSALYWAMFAQVYLLEIAALILLLRRFFGLRHIYRRQMALLLAAVFLPWAANVYFQIASRQPGGAAPVDFTPLTFAASAGLVSGAIFRLKLFDLIPIARSRALEYIPQMVLTLDAEDRVLDVNETGQRWLGKPAAQIIGASARDTLGIWSGLLDLFHDKRQTYNQEAKIPGEPPRILEAAAIPLFNRGKLEGRVLVAHDVTNRVQLEEELQQANEALQRRVAEVEALREKLEEQAIRDPLTGAYNRRYLTDSIDRQLAQAAQRFNVLSVAILDLDRFSALNETYGLNCGDVVLQLLAKHIFADLRRGDILARYEGEQFVVLLPGLSLESAYARVEKWRGAFGAALIEYEGSLLSATFSAGIACFPIHGENGKDLLQAAERALSQAKSGGRNRVIVYS